MSDKVRCLVKGAISGGAGVWLMDRFTWYWYSHENTETLVKERQAQIGGRYTPNVAGKHLTDALGLSLPQKYQYVVGRSVHYFMGMAPGAIFALYMKKPSQFSLRRGLLYGFGLFIVFDEILTPGLGYAKEPAAYPWQAHARGFFAHLILGATTDLFLTCLSGHGHLSGRESRSKRTNP